MADVVNLSWADCRTLARETSQRIREANKGVVTVFAYPVPRGGIPAAFLVQGMCVGNLVVEMTEHPQDADIFIDDIIDTGRTRDSFSCYGRPFYALVDKTGRDARWVGKWVSFFWERLCKESGPEENIVRILEFLGEDPSRGGLKETPARVVKSYAELYSGYKQKPEDVIKLFEDGSEGYDELVLLKDIEFTSNCEHHMLPFFGRAHIGYIPDGRVIGISKLARILEIYSRRLQVQERLTTQVTAALDEHLKPKGSACILEASHSCISCRGVGKQHAVLTTSSLTGAFREKPEARAELLALIRG